MIPTGERTKTNKAKPAPTMSIKKFTLIEPSVLGLDYLAIVETDGDLVAMDDFAFTADRRTYTLTYEVELGALPDIHVWDMRIQFTNKGLREIEYRIVENTDGSDLYPHKDRPEVKDGL